MTGLEEYVEGRTSSPRSAAIGGIAEERHGDNLNIGRRPALSEGSTGLCFRYRRPLIAPLQRDGRLLAAPGQRVERWCEDDHHWIASYHLRQRGIFGLKVIYGDPFNAWEKRPQKGVELAL